MKVYTMQAEHFAVQGIIFKVCATRSIAVAEGIAYANKIISDCPDMTPVETEAEMELAIEYIQNIHGAAHCYVEIAEHQIIGT